MKFTIPAGDFVDGLKSVQARAHGTAAKIDMLKHIRFGVAGSRLTLLAHDLTSSSEAYLAIDEGSDGSCAVPADAIVRLVSSLPRAAHIAVERDQFQITIKTGRSRYKLPVIVSDDFPNALLCEKPASVDLDAAALAQLVDRPRAALDPKDPRPFCMGAYVHTADGVVCSAATDGKHFVRYSSAVSCPDLIGVIVPSAALDEIVRLGPGKLSISERTVAHETADRRFCSKLIDERYINYSSVPALIDNYVEVDRAELLACFLRLASVAKADSQLHLSVGDGEISLSLTGMGEGAETVQCSGEPLKNAFVAASALQFIDAMKMLNGEVLQLHITPQCRAFRIFDPFEPTAILAQSTQVPKMMQTGAAA